MTEKITKNDLDAVRSMLTRANGAMSAHSLLKSDSERSSDIDYLLNNLKYESLSKIPTLLDNDRYNRIYDNFPEITFLVSVYQYDILARCVDDYSEKTEVLRIAGDEIIESELKEVIAILEQLAEKIESHLIEAEWRYE